MDGGVFCTVHLTRSLTLSGLPFGEQHAMCSTDVFAFWQVREQLRRLQEREAVAEPSAEASICDS